MQRIRQSNLVNRIPRACNVGVKTFHPKLDKNICDLHDLITYFTDACDAKWSLKTLATHQTLKQIDLITKLFKVNYLLLHQGGGNAVDDRFHSFYLNMLLYKQSSFRWF